MADKPTTPPEEAPASPTTFDVTLDEFCAEASTRGYGIEMLGGFFADATLKGPTKASRETFQAALDAFITRPV
jgi:hypothetical protein